ncbi:hypothetical protein [Sodalis-like endosymbiont of Proechinophthirus fluctus]|nr:hypothetical protein [Sodalis-like endosymbiont of Proechinophthirus fluctus]
MCTAVTNFSHGDDCLDVALSETRAAIAYGADEVDIVSLSSVYRRQ